MLSVSPKPLTRRSFARGLAVLRDADPDLAAAVETFGPPPLWTRPAGFATLVHIILEQQVSLASARAAFSRLERALPEMTVDAFLELSGDRLRKIGFSRQKAGYCRGLARAIVDGSLDLEALGPQADRTARATLMEIRGIGAWTADIYLLMALRRPDVWPSGDLALAVAAREVKRLRKRPDPERLRRLGAAWRPWRAIAARLLWHAYLSRRGDGAGGVVG